MKLPMSARDVKAIVDAAVGVDADADAPVSASVYVDETAPADVIAHVRGAFAGASAQARITIGYLGKGRAIAGPDDDFAVVVAGLGSDAGKAAFDLRAQGVPVMIATTMPLFAEAIAADAGFPVPEGDIVSPATGGPAVEAARSRASRDVASVRAATDENAARRGREVASAARDRAALDEAFAAEPYRLDRAAASLLDQRMGEWVVEAAYEKRLAMARAFPFVRRPLALDAVNATAVQNAGIGLVPFIPGADLPLMTINQAKMVLQIASAYGESMDASRAREVLGVVGAAFACRSIARSLAGVVPALGWAVRAAVGYGGTMAIGRAAIECFECGGGLRGFAGFLANAGEAAARIVSEEAGVRPCPAKGAAEVARVWVRRAEGAVDAAAKAAGPIAARAARAGADSFVSGVASLARDAAGAVQRLSR